MAPTKTTRTRKQAAPSLTAPAQPATVTNIIRQPSKRKGHPMDFGTPVPVSDLPPAPKKGGRSSNVPAFEAWLAQLAPGQTYELASIDEDGGHPVGRVSQIRKVAGDAFKIETRAIEVGKRYRIFATVAT